MLQYQLKMEDAPILRLLDAIIVQGLEARASDIHLEPGMDSDRVRYRISVSCFPTMVQDWKSKDTTSSMWSWI